MWKLRAVFTVELTKKDENFPPDEELAALLDGLGRGFKNLGEMTRGRMRAIMTAQSKLSPHEVPHPEAVIGDADSHNPPHSMESYEDRRAKYRELAEELFTEMPEVAGAELGGVIYVGIFQRYQALFAVTSMNKREVTFRLLHRELPRLQASTVQAMKDLLTTWMVEPCLRRDEVEVNVYERKFENVIITGKVITHPLREAQRVNLKDILLTIVPLILFIPATIIVGHWDQWTNNGNQFWHGQLERFSTALLTTSLVSALGFIQTYVQIKRSKLIDWSVKTTISRK